MIEVRLFAGLRQGRQKIYQMEPGSVNNVQDIMDVLNIQRKEVNILLINGFHKKASFPYSLTAIIFTLMESTSIPVKFSTRYFKKEGTLS